MMGGGRLDEYGKLKRFRLPLCVLPLLEPDFPPRTFVISNSLPQFGCGLLWESTLGEAGGQQ